ncbi:STM4504/CBY_0614 family protein [Kosakonia cowanii]|uniref:STM4504/CBY_0614 family protein n=1 Tax=Kosakonia cowanii TaxID=208223 RepID=UPI003EE7A840
MMAIYDIYSKRQRRIRGEVKDVYQYEDIPSTLKVQIVQIIRDSIGNPAPINKWDYFKNEADKTYKAIHDVLCREYGVFSLCKYAENEFTALFDGFFLQNIEIEKCLDLIELCFKVLTNHVAGNPHLFRGLTRQKPEDAITELNERFRESSVGFQFISGEIIRIDSQLIHSEVVIPVLHFLGNDNVFSGANDEFLLAHDHYKHKRYKECLNDCLKSFESLMKAIHDKHSWQYNKNDTASKLINSCMSHGLIPNYLQSQFTSLKTMLETGVPTIRNKNSAHGQGSEVTAVNQGLVSYMLHLTATNLLFLAQCEESLMVSSIKNS